MKKILFYYGSMGSGGAERVLINVLKSLDRTKFEISLALIDARAGETLQYIPKDVKIIPLWDGYTLPYRISLKISKLFGCNYFFKRHLNEVLRNGFDVEISFLEGMPLKLHYIHHSLKALNINWVHIDLNKFRYTSNLFYHNEELKAYSSMDKIVCVAQDTQAAFLQRFPSLADKTCVIYNSIDIKNIQEKAKAFTVENDTFTIVTACRLAEQKALDRLIYVAKAIKEDNLPIKFQIIGEGPLLEKLKTLSKEIQVNDIVNFLGYKENPFPYIKAADLMLSTSIAEGFGLSICEAMCLGTPIVSTEVSGPIEILDNSKYGQLCGHSINEIKEAVLKLYSSTSLREHYSKMGLKRMEIFDAKHINEQIEGLLTKEVRENADS